MIGRVRARLSQVVFDCREPRALVRFWAGLLGGVPVDRSHGWSYLQAPGFPQLGFQPVSDERVVKNPLHLDLAVDDLDAAVAEAVRLGARCVGGVCTDEQGSFRVMQDPEGNEFCFVRNDHGDGHQIELVNAGP